MASIPPTREMSWVDGWRGRLLEALDLPPDVLPDFPRITLLGDLQLSVENHRGLIRYSPEEICVGWVRGRIRISGEDLRIGHIHLDEMTIVGHIQAVDFEE